MKDLRYSLSVLIVFFVQITTNAQHCLLDSTFEKREFNEITVKYTYDSPSDYQTYSVNHRMDNNVKFFRERNYLDSLVVYEREWSSSNNYQNESIWDYDEKGRMIFFHLKGTFNTQTNFWSYDQVCGEVDSSSILLTNRGDTTRFNTVKNHYDLDCRLSGSRNTSFTPSGKVSKIDSIALSRNELGPNSFELTTYRIKISNGIITIDTTRTRTIIDTLMAKDTVIIYTRDYDLDKDDTTVDSSIYYQISWNNRYHPDGWLSLTQSKYRTAGEFGIGAEYNDTLIFDIHKFNIAQFAGPWREAIPIAEWDERIKFFRNDDGLLEYSEITEVDDNTFDVPQRKWYYYTKISSTEDIIENIEQAKVIHYLDPNKTYINLTGQVTTTIGYPLYLIELIPEQGRVQRVLYIP